jgi:hypothetical protein
MSQNVCFIDKNGDIGSCLRENAKSCKGCLSEGMHNRFLVEIEKSMPRSRSDPVWFRKNEKIMRTMTELPDRCSHEFDHIELTSADVEQIHDGTFVARARLVCIKCRSELQIKQSDYF